MMPSQYTADISQEDAKQLADTLHVRYDVIPIDSIYQTFQKTLHPHIHDKAPAITYENIQARARGMILMALSNATGKIVLNTGNRSELATGYCTLYGDMVGGFAVLKDVLKTTVYELAHYRNSIQPIIPERTITRAPTAELAPNQKDEDSLPPYPILDDILKLYLTGLKSKQEIVAAGFDEKIVDRVIQLVRRNEYKRKQAPIGTHINHKSFGKDWRFPLTNGFDESQ
jgi:NAD+ synthase (glutamine-hydrolysing)